MVRYVHCGTNPLDDVVVALVVRVNVVRVDSNAGFTRSARVNRWAHVAWVIRYRCRRQPGYSSPLSVQGGIICTVVPEATAGHQEEYTDPGKTTEMSSRVSIVSTPGGMTTSKTSLLC